MIIIDFSCDTGHRFSGYFMNHEAYREQLEKKNISCPLCDSREVRRAYTGCSIRVKSSSPSDRGGEALPLFQAIRQFNRFVREHFENVEGNSPMLPGPFTTASKPSVPCTERHLSMR